MLWILIRIDLAVLDPDPDPYWDADPEVGKLTKISKETWFPAFQKGFCTFLDTYDLRTITHLPQVHISYKNSTFCDFKA